VSVFCRVSVCLSALLNRSASGFPNVLTVYTQLKAGPRAYAPTSLHKVRVLLIFFANMCNIFLILHVVTVHAV